MNKVLIEITPYKAITKIIIDGKEFVEEQIKTQGGATHEGVDFESTEEISDDLYDAFNSFFIYDVMKALNNMG